MLRLASFAKFTEEPEVTQTFYEGPEAGLSFLTTGKGMNKFKNGSGISLLLEECDSMI